MYVENRDDVSEVNYEDTRDSNTEIVESMHVVSETESQFIDQEYVMNHQHDSISELAVDDDFIYNDDPIEHLNQNIIGAENNDDDDNDYDEVSIKYFFDDPVTAINLLL